MRGSVVDWVMKLPIFVQPLTDAEFAAIERGCHSPDAFTLRRCQILLASAQAQTPPVIAAALSCSVQTVRNALHAFNIQGLASLQRQSSRPKTIQPLFDAARAEALRALLHRSPRDFGYPTSVWTLDLAAQACYREGITPWQVSRETIRQALKGLKISWRRAKHWITSPDPAYLRKKRRRDRLIELAQRYGWVIGYLDEVWWSRFALPMVRMWSDPQRPARLHEQTPVRTDADPKALACYGLWCEPPEEMLLRFVTGRPVSHVTTAFLAWVCEQLAQRGQRVLVLIWDNASWHISQEVQAWIAAHNAAAKRSGQGVRILVAGLPTKSPWLNTIEPQWKHGKEAIVEADGVLTGAEVEARVCAYFGTVPQAHLVQRGQEAGDADAPLAGTSLREVHRREQPAQAVKTQQAA